MVIIGSDSPDLPVKFICKAFQRLDRYDVVLGPSLDGGYYLIGLKTPCEELFKGIKWSTATVLADTINRAKKLQKRIAILNKWYDVDEPRSLTHLKRVLKKQKDKRCARWTRKFLKI